MIKVYNSCNSIINSLTHDVPLGPRNVALKQSTKFLNATFHCTLILLTIALLAVHSGLCLRVSYKRGGGGFGGTRG